MPTFPGISGCATGTSKCWRVFSKEGHFGGKECVGLDISSKRGARVGGSTGLPTLVPQEGRKDPAASSRSALRGASPSGMDASAWRMLSMELPGGRGDFDNHMESFTDDPVVKKIGLDPWHGMATPYSSSQAVLDCSTSSTSPGLRTKCRCTGVSMTTAR